ncbi:hypothetical protein AYY26_02970 [Photobacterium phosphoreum]|uniref:alpha-1,2-fucosyltransferase n=1 Tax=Photobacterium phosphoreum TaxID=659 RepID=UPI0007F9682E|nr:alpha-1,2-fucosyltransferase [Photobacterium phosphoreum]OBU45377.1 hypothetical protein AYY26_02970 [Photobacterium phosphoreum]
MGCFFNFDNFYYNDILKKQKVIYLYGYFQSESYFSESRINVINFFSYYSNDDNYKILRNNIISSDSIAISMRLGDDYINSKELNVCNNVFYYKALNLIYNKKPTSKLFVFSDNISDAKKIINNSNIKFSDVVYISGVDDCQSLSLMSLCDDFIISNSSFSWWGAYLSSNDDKIIVAPKKWYTYMSKKVSIYTENMELI